MVVIRKFESVVRMFLFFRVFDVEGVSDFFGVVVLDLFFLMFGRFFVILIFGSLIIGNKDRIVGKLRDDVVKCFIVLVYFCCLNRY